jgi:thioesterase domain-containing protein
MIDEKYKEMVKMSEDVIKITKEMGVKIIVMQDRHVKVLMPLEPNINHIGMMYAGSLFTAAEYVGGPIFFASFNKELYYPLVKAINIQFRRPAKTDVTVEVTLSEAEVAAIQKVADEKGKADWKMDLEIKDTDGQVCALVQGVWQMRKWGT